MISSGQHDAVLEALNEVRNRKESFTQAMAELREIREKAMTKNKQIEATVDSAGRLTELTLRGDRWREMAPSELCTKIIEVVGRAQDKAAAKMNEKMTGFLPSGVDLKEMRKNGPDVDAIIEEAIESVEKWSR